MKLGESPHYFPGPSPPHRPHPQPLMPPSPHLSIFSSHRHGHRLHASADAADHGADQHRGSSCPQAPPGCKGLPHGPVQVSVSTRAEGLQEGQGCLGEFPHCPTCCGLTSTLPLWVTMLHSTEGGPAAAFLHWTNLHRSHSGLGAALAAVG